MKKTFGIFSLLTSLAGCVTMNGTYIVAAYDASGKELGSNVRMVASGSSIYIARNALCSRYRQSIIKIKDATTGDELKGESPYQCR